MTTATGYTQEYVIDYLSGRYRCLSLHPVNEQGGYDSKVFLIPENSLGNKLWGMVDYLCNHCGWKWRKMTKDLYADAQKLRKEAKEKKIKSRKGSHHRG